MPRFQVVTTELEVLASTASVDADALVATIDDLAAAVEGLIGSSWIGQDSLVFAAAFREWMSGAVRVTASLRRISALLDNSHSSYDETERSVTATLLSDTSTLIAEGNNL